MKSESEFNPSQPPLVREGQAQLNSFHPPYIPYQQKLVSRARELRHDSTEAEKFFWKEILKHKKFGHLKFTRQKPIDAFIFDFYCAHLKLGIEIDGEIHDQQITRDTERDNILKEKFGIICLRYTNREVLEQPEQVIQNLESVIRALSQKSP